MKGILFKEELFKAVIEGRKTLTRRIMKPQPDGVIDGTPWKKRFIEIFDDEKIEIIKTDKTKDGHQIIEHIKPKYQIGETVYLKEPYWASPSGKKENTVYAFNLPYVNRRFYPFKNKLFMPEKYARYFIKITGVRVQRVDEISEEDARAEGVFIHHVYPSPRMEFADLWDKINPENKWNSNPWVWVYEFELVKGKI